MALRSQDRQHGVGELGRGEEVELHPLGRELLGGAERAAPGDVGQHVDAAEAVERRPHASLARQGVGDV